MTAAASYSLDDDAAVYPCHVCGRPTALACADCRIDLGVSVHVCELVACRNAHEAGYCSARLRKRLREGRPHP